MVTRWGMTQEVGLLALSGVDQGNFLETGAIPGQARPYSEATAEMIDHATREIVDSSYAKAIDLLSGERPRLDSLAQALLREESLDMKAMLEVTGLPERPVSEPAAAAR